MSTHIYDAASTLRERFDDATRLYTAWDENGVQTEQRPYTAEENSWADTEVNAQAVSQARAEFERATALNSAPEELAALQAAILAAEGIVDGDPWRQPTGAHDAYPLGAVVSHQDKTWESTVAANVWEPGVSGWLEAGPGIPDWVQPTGAHDAYPLGAKVWHIEKLWQSNVDGNVWEPPEQWTEVVGARLRRTLRHT